MRKTNKYLNKIYFSLHLSYFVPNIVFSNIEGYAKTTCIE